ncbi:MAG: TrkA C-terminal domain-containing protein [Bacteroidetes bacterium]|nr:TrkA C-terminal domain-containing protein [Bacteroidota bacterium]
MGFKHKHKGFIFNPSLETVIGEDDILIVLGSNDDINSFKKHYL